MKKALKIIGLSAASILVVVTSLYAAIVNGYLDFTVITAPSNPASGFARLYITSSGIGCLTSSGGSCLGGFSNPMTTLGDVILGGTSGTPQRLAVGSNTKVLTANSSATNGVDWESPSSSSFTASPPYLVASGVSYIPSDGLYTATLPAASPTWLSTTATATPAANGNLLLTSASGTTAFAAITATASIEAVFNCYVVSAGSCGIWIYDSTHSTVYSLILAQNGSGVETWDLLSFSYSGSGNPTFASTVWSSTNTLKNGTVHAKLSVTGSTLSPQLSLDGGITFFSAGPTVGSIGTITKGGYNLSISDQNIMSLKGI